MNKNLFEKLKNHAVRKAKGPWGLGQRADLPHGPMSVPGLPVKSKKNLKFHNNFFQM